MGEPRRPRTRIWGPAEKDPGTLHGPQPQRARAVSAGRLPGGPDLDRGLRETQTRSAWRDVTVTPEKESGSSDHSGREARQL